ncbi:uncharacterized protein BCR38DRAFT_103076 [Pseudomassariella vexata]|uniref:Uncharacterized protein n=1 Tax=Pseudomassariella vexata TaxID=1141098 RepID=A0A1Y2EG18_9PEZI|nr:uncharacterized protein BCR38DRAFT_103076 [Pseudomassariella vexata]ORY70254.1 hypothetical protein BCR38DRAFT_103076 [Pseudomassariella vexata]
MTQDCDVKAADARMGNIMIGEDPCSRSPSLLQTQRSDPNFRFWKWNVGISGDSGHLRESSRVRGQNGHILLREATLGSVELCCRKKKLTSGAGEVELCRASGYHKLRSTYLLPSTSSNLAYSSRECPICPDELIHNIAAFPFYSFSPMGNGFASPFRKVRRPRYMQ